MKHDSSEKTRRNAHFGSVPLLWGGPPALPAASRHGGEGRGGGSEARRAPEDGNGRGMPCQPHSPQWPRCPRSAVPRHRRPHPALHPASRPASRSRTHPASRPASLTPRPASRIPHPAPCPPPYPTSFPASLIPHPLSRIPPASRPHRARPRGPAAPPAPRRSRLAAGGVFSRRAPSKPLLLLKSEAASSAAEAAGGRRGWTGGLGSRRPEEMSLCSAGRGSEHPLGPGPGPTVGWAAPAGPRGAPARRDPRATPVRRGWGPSPRPCPSIPGP